MMETNDQAKLRLAGVEIADLRYELETLRNGTAKRPWRWVKKFQLGGGNHWCLESIPEPDNGVGDGHDRTVGIVLHDHWSQHPTELMLFVQNEINRSGERQQEIDRLKAQNEIMKAQRTEQISENQLLKAENEKLRGLVWLADKGRCMKCEWPLESSPDKGCVPGNCSYRPHDGTVEHAKWAERNALIAKAREVLGE